MPYLLGIDYGTGGAKAAMVDDAGELAGYAFEEYPILTPKPGWSEHDAEGYWQAACRLIPAVLADAGADPAAIRGIAVSSALPSLVMIDAAGTPVANAYNLMDRRATDIVAELLDEFGAEAIFDMTKNRLEDHPAIVNLIWEKKHRPEIFARVNRALTIDGFITRRLTGVDSLHLSGAPFFGVAYDMMARRFDAGVLERIGLDAGLFPRLYRCEDLVGGVTAEAAAQTGLAAGIPVAAGQVDCNAGWSGAGAIAPGDIQMNLGTCGNFGILHDKPVFQDTMIAFPYTTDSENLYITVPTTTTGGQLIRYLRDTLWTAERDAAANGGPDPYDLINIEAAKVPAGSEGLVILPYLMGERTPLWDAEARGVFFGLSLNHGRVHIARAAMESVAYALYDSWSILRDSGLDINGPLILNEGGAKSHLWREIITDVFGIPTAMVESRAGAPYGDAILAGVATGVFPDFSVARAKTRIINHREPDMEKHGLYMEYFCLYKDLYSHVKDDYRRLAELRRRFQGQET